MRTESPTSLAAAILAAGITCAAASDGYRLVWADEFERNGPPDPANWTYEEGFVRNEEHQWYQPDNAFCEGGFLVIEGRREHRRNPGYQEGSSDWRKNREYIEYTSACLITRGLHSWQFGRFEVRARIRTEEGLWPAIWFLGLEGRWPNNGEIDLMEYYDDSILANACWGTDRRGTPKWDSVKRPIASFNDPAFQAKFHLWRMDWDAGSIRLYLDDLLLNTIDLAEAVNPHDRWGPQQPFHQPHYLLLNLAIGGRNGGDPAKASYPSRYEIDYVRIYQRTE